MEQLARKHNCLKDIHKLSIVWCLFVTKEIILNKISKLSCTEGYGVSYQQVYKFASE